MEALRPFQPTLEGLTDETMPRLALRDRASLSRMLTPRAWGVSDATYSEVTTRAIEAAEPENLRPDLINVRAHHGASASYPDVETHRDVWVALAPVEYGLLARSPRALGRAATQRSLAKQPAGQVFDETAQGRALRAADHTLQTKTERMTQYDANVLVPRSKLLGKFLVAAEHPGLSQFGKEVTHLMEMTTYRSIMDDMLLALGQQRNWGERSGNPQHIARLALEWRILFDRIGNRHIGNFHDLTQLMLDHNNAKHAVFRSKIHEARQEMRGAEKR